MKLMTAKMVKLKMNTYMIIDDAIEAGIRFGYSRAFKHTDKPHEETIVQSIHDSIMNNLCEVVDFDNDGS